MPLGPGTRTSRSGGRPWAFHRLRPGKKNKEDSRIKSALETYRKSPEFGKLSERDRAQFESQPAEFFSKRPEETVEMPARYFDDNAGEGETVSVPVKTAAQFWLAQHRKGGGRTPAGQELLSEFATREVYKKLKKTPQEIEQLPRQITIDDARTIVPRSPCSISPGPLTHLWRTRGRRRRRNPLEVFAAPHRKPRAEDQQRPGRQDPRNCRERQSQGRGPGEGAETQVLIGSHGERI